MKFSFRRFILALLPVWGAVLLFQSRSFAQLPVAARTAPAWLHDGVVYEVFPRDFSPAGNLNGVTVKLDELKKLGVNILWLMPIHPIGLDQRKGTYGSPYSARDYYAVNPDYGTKEDLQHLVAEAHQRGMKVIIDIVLLHTAWDSVLMSHPDFYKHDASGKIVPPVPEWDDVAGLNYQNPALRQYLIEMLKYWVQTANIDGYRCDTASMIPTSFWETARSELDKVKPGLIMLAEADKPELLTNAFDIDYEWPLLNTLRNVLGKSAPASEIHQAWENDLKRYPSGALHLNMSDNHDQQRAVSCFGLSGALAASALMFTLNGVPLIYNGMEVGASTESHDPELFEKVPINWQPKSAPRVRNIYRDLIKLRQQHAAFRTDQVRWIDNSAENHLVTFLRADGTEEFLIAVNLSSEPISSHVEVKGGENFAPVKIASVQNSDASPPPDLHLTGYEWRIYHRPLALATVK